MNSTLAYSRLVAAKPTGERLTIDGFPVSDLFDEVYEQTRDLAGRFGKPVQFEVIAWSELTIAAHAGALKAALVQTIRWCLATEDTQGVTVRAYPCHDDVWAVFDLQADLFSDERSQPEAWKPALYALRTAIQRMGGEWEPVASYADCRRITFRLPQWVNSGAELSLRVVCA